MSRHAPVVLLAVLALLGGDVTAQNCSGTSIGQLPIDDLGAGTYLGAEGGLYPGGLNVRPPAHEGAGLAEAALVQPLDGTGNPDPAGRIVLLSIGMSNTTQEYSTFQTLSDSDPDRNGSLTLVDGAQGGQDAATISNPLAPFWSNVDQRLLQRGVTPGQVQAVWLKEAVAGPTGTFGQHVTQLRNYLRDIVRIIRSRYPNCRLCYLSSRTYAGYATSTLNPEPYAYESAWAVKGVIEQQIAGAPGLNFDPTSGPVLAPWLSWGPYLWADGTVPRSDGLTWDCFDFNADGTHPNQAGRLQVAQLLDAFFTSDTTTVSWYASAGGNLPLPAGAVLYGEGCPGTQGLPWIVTNGPPRLGRLNFMLGLQGARPLTPATLLVATHSASIPVGGCTLLINPLTLLLPAVGFPSTFPTNGSGSANLFAGIPNDPALDQLSLFAQWFVPDPQGVPVPPIGPHATTLGLELRFGH